MKDIFIDTNAALHLHNPVDAEYKNFLRWLFSVGCLAVSNALLTEYGRSNQNLITITDRLLREGRLNRISNNDLKKIRHPKQVERKFTSNRKDWEHIKVVMLSHRKYAIIEDKNFRNDVNNYPKVKGKKAIGVSRPEEISYTN